MSAAPPPPTTPYEALGGEAGVRRLVATFYDRMDADSLRAQLMAAFAHTADFMRNREG